MNGMYVSLTPFRCSYFVLLLLAQLHDAGHVDLEDGVDVRRWYCLDSTMRTAIIAAHLGHRLKGAAGRGGRRLPSGGRLRRSRSSGVQRPGRQLGSAPRDYAE
jgi:hypothetical protein